MDNKNIDILANREQYEYHICQKNIELFENYITDYENLKNRLASLADKTRHDIMIPLAGSKLAFMPGYIHHTNEILVLIGDNYFVEKSTKESIEFINRRIKFCQTKLEELEKQKSLLIKWLETTENFKEESSQLVDITETCTDEEHDRWLKEHNRKVKLEQKQSTTNRPSNDNIKFDFEKYEQQEKQNKEMETKNDQPDKTTKIQAPKSQPIQLDIMEKNIPSQTTTSTINTSQRPISKFKASRIKK